MSVSSIKLSLSDHGAESIEQVFPLWIELAGTRLHNKVIRMGALAVARLLTKLEAEPVIILIAKKGET